MAGIIDFNITEWSKAGFVLGFIGALLYVLGGTEITGMLLPVVITAGLLIVGRVIFGQVKGNVFRNAMFWSIFFGNLILPILALMGVFVTVSLAFPLLGGIIGLLAIVGFMILSVIEYVILLIVYKLLGWRFPE